MHSASVVRVAAALLLFATASSGLAQPAMFRGGAAHLGVYDSDAPTLQDVVWKFTTGGRVLSSPLVVGEAIYVGSTDGALYALNRAHGERRWTFETRGPVSSSPAFANGLVFVASLDGMMIGMRTMMTLGSVLSSPVVAGGVVYFGSTDGKLYAVR